MTITSAICDSAKLQLLLGQHVFAASGGDPFFLALIMQNPTGNYDETTTNYSQLVINGDELTAPGYSAGGAALVTIAPAIANGVASVTFNNPSWSGVTWSTDGALLYNAKNGTAIGVFSFGSTQVVNDAVFTVLMPAAVVTLT